MIWASIKHAIKDEWKGAGDDKSTEIFAKAISSFLDANFGAFYKSLKLAEQQAWIWSFAREQELKGNRETYDASFVFLTEKVIPTITFIYPWEENGLLSWRHIALMFRGVIKENKTLESIEKLISAIDQKLLNPFDVNDEDT